MSKCKQVDSLYAVRFREISVISLNHVIWFKTVIKSSMSRKVLKRIFVFSTASEKLSFGTSEASVMTKSGSHLKTLRHLILITNRHVTMGTFLALLALRERITDYSPNIGTIMRTFDVSFVVSLNNLLNKNSRVVGNSRHHGAYVTLLWWLRYNCESSNKSQFGFWSI